MTYTLNRKNSLFYYIAIALIAMLLTLFYYNSIKVKSTGKWVEHTQEIIDKNNEILLDIINIETGARGFLLTNEESFLVHYNVSQKKIFKNLESLLTLTKENPDQQVRVKQLKKSITERIEISKSLIDNNNNNNNNKELELATIIKGKAKMEAIRLNIKAINLEELALLKHRKSENAVSTELSKYLLYALFFLLFVLVFFIYYLFKNHKKQSLELESFNTYQKEASQYSLSLIEASLDPLVTINNEGKITDLNQATVRVTGIEKNNLIGSDFFGYFTDHQKAREVYQKVFTNGLVTDAPLTIRHKEGKLTDVLFNGSVYKDELGDIKGVVIVARDIAEQKWALDLRKAYKELELQNEEKEYRANELLIANEELAFQNQEKENRANELLIANQELEYQSKLKEKKAQELIIADIELDFQNQEKEKRAIENKELEAYSYSLKLASQYSLSLIEASRDPLFTISPDGKITDTNQASVRVTDVVKENLIGSDFIKYFTEPEKAKSGYEEVFSKGFVVDYPLTIKDGKLTPVLFNGSVYKDTNNNVIGAVVVARDITEQKKAEKELTEAKVFAELATTIAEKATYKAEESVKSKQQFLSNMSHEIRTPMNAIIGFTKVVLKTELTAKQKEYLTAIKMSGDALIVLINDILDLAKVDAGKMTFEKTPFKLNLSIKAMLHLFETKIQEKNLKLVTIYDKNIPDILIGDPVRLHQIILNLVSNAVKFTNKGEITVSINLLSENEDKVTLKIAVADTGIGIKDTKLERVFDNFQQATSGTSRLFGGTGLGLAIVKQLVEGQNGKIEVESEFGKGSTFSFILDFNKTTKEAVLEPEIMELNSDIKNIKILVVEDMELNQLLMKTLLDDFGFECEIAGNGKIAVEKLETKTFDIILMDLQMPEMNGFEATEYIRKTMKLDIPIIALTADVTTVDVAKCKEVGMDDYISKPVDERLLYSKLTSVIKKPVVIIEHIKGLNAAKDTVKYVDMNYLLKLTKSNPILMTEMIGVYLKQTPPLVRSMKQSYLDKEWQLLQATVHKMIPSFTIMGMSPEITEVAQKIQEFANKLELSDDLDKLISQLENVCNQSFTELEIELTNLKN
ncbi:CHASE3 domain-containing protein [Flavobacterium sp.]|uniref:CHASE3 domain-containing protein n=1 Tax=Flavobacterium sp. TaxID=239 RepID=UPI00374DF3EA